MSMMDEINTLPLLDMLCLIMVYFKILTYFCIEKYAPTLFKTVILRLKFRFFFLQIEHTFALKHLYLCADYHSWIVGNPGDFKLADESVLDGGVLLAGGSTDQDEAYRWFLTRARGGDVIVIRDGKEENYDDYPNNDAYNKYFYSDLGVQVDSVETIFLNSRTVADSSEVARKIRQAEAIFFTGGDQWYYYKYIDNTRFQDALDYAIEVKKVVVGGTSAGCAIQGEFVFTAEVDSIITSEALADPYDAKLTIGRNLLRHTILKNTITDTHYNERGRQGRHIAFMARVLKDSLDYNFSIVRGIGVDEQTVVCIESSGLARVFGNRDAYFLQQNSQQEAMVESGILCTLTKEDILAIWHRNKKINWVNRQLNYFT
ncbi:cyanophycinase [Brachionus plicatilis]|uniref:Cyanophycinase n=1 Tax=Brachionus plicatilis TaxID=10195 RepID=A0A3M7QF12_BRAPC|nr:cyanophycinase [Brachionus plicatilis]